MGPDWSIVDSDEFEMEADNREEEEQEEEGEKADIYHGKKFKKIFLPRPLVNGKNFVNGDMESLELEEDEDEEELDEEEEDNNEEEEGERGEEKEEDEDEEEESYREGQVFKSLLMLARYKSVHPKHE